MKKDYFERIQKDYIEGRKKLEGISIGDLVFDVAHVSMGVGGDNRPWIQIRDCRYFPAVVKSVDVDEDKVTAVSVDDGKLIWEGDNFTSNPYMYRTESDLIRQKILDEKSIIGLHQRYADTIKEVKEGKR